MANRRQFINTLGLLALTGSAFAQPIKRARAPKAVAILVGVSKFDHLSIAPLDGPPNDIALMRRALQVLGYHDSGITTLVDTQPERLHPTRSNILRVLREEAVKLRRGDIATVYFSGHGAQIPQRLPIPKSRWVEPDGLDEIFLTRDTKYWNKQTKSVEGGLLDDDIGEALAAFTQKGVRVWAIFDTCHSGDMSRTAPSVQPSEGMTFGETIWRGIHPITLGVPAEEIRSSGSRQPTRRAGARKKTPQRSDGVLVEFFATQPNEDAPEEFFVTSGGALQRHGVFSWELAKTILGGNQKFDQIARAIEANYAPRPFPTPLFRTNDAEKRGFPTPSTKR